MGSAANAEIRVEVRRHSESDPWTYALLDLRQRQIAAQVRDGGAGALLVSEVAPVVTLGRRTQNSDLLLSAQQLESQGVQVLEVDRGGLATWHGPGQWVAFAVDSLERLTGDRRGVRRAVEALLEAACEAARPWAPSAEIRDGCETGVWIPGQGKLASVGVHIDQGVLLHGLSLNAFATPLSFRGIRACGLDAAPAYLWDTQAEPGAREDAFLELQQRLITEIRARFWGRGGHEG